MVKEDLELVSGETLRPHVPKDEMIVGAASDERIAALNELLTEALRVGLHKHVRKSICLVMQCNINIDSGINNAPSRP